MCGIAGKIYFDLQQKITPTEIIEMTEVISHRGPDDEGNYINENIGLGFRRLSIIDLEHGHQPLCNEDGSVWIVFNGEIYNYKELHDFLITKGHIFKTQSDTETIVHLYEEYGTSCLQYLRGMFAFAIWDNSKKELFCARDRFGIKPFYYYTDNNKFLFASEIKAILTEKRIDKTISQDALNSYFAYGYITSNLSIYDKIKKLPAAHYLLLALKQNTPIKIQKYWQIEFEPDFSRSEEKWTEEIEACFMDTVKLHMRSEVPFGAFLSGGIDSASIVAMMAANSNKPIKTFSIGFKEKKYNELEYAREVAQQYGCEFHEYIVEPESLGLLPKLVNAYDEPFADTSAIPTYYVSKFAREYVTVTLSGDGGDELFAGYSIYNYLRKIYTYNSAFPSLNKLLWGSIHRLIPHTMMGKGLTYYLSQNREYLGAHLYTWTEEERKRLILNNEYNKTSSSIEDFKKGILGSGKRDFISNLQYLDLQTYLVDDILTKADRASMMNSLELRVPFLDHKFAELTFKIPSTLKIKGNDQKYVFKRAMKKHLPYSILHQPKRGFDIPISKWFKNELKEYVDDTLLSQKPLLANYLNEKYVKKTVSDNTSGMRDFSSKIWSLLFFEEWLKQNQ